MRNALPRPDLSTATRLLLAPAAIVVLLLAFAGRADAGAWGPAVSVSAAGQLANKEGIATDAAGDQVATWEVSAGNNEYFVQAAVRSGGSWSAPVDLTGPVRFERNPVVAVNAAGEAVVAWSTWTGGNNQVELVHGDVSDSWGAPEIISTPGVNSGSIDVALDAAGDAFASWRQMVEGGDYEPAVTTDEGGSWSTPHLLNPSTAYSNEEPILKVDPAGDAVVAWDRNEGVEAASRPAGGTWSEPTVLANHGTNSVHATVEVAMNDAGEAAAIWAAENGGLHVETARMSPSGTWTAAEIITPSTLTYNDTTIALTPSGEEVAVWTGDTDAAREILAARRPAGGAWTEPTMLAAAGEQYSLSVVVDATGLATVLWDKGYEAEGEWLEAAEAARFSASGAWGPELEISEAGEYAYYPILDADATGGITVAWMDWVETAAPSYESVVRSVYLPGATPSEGGGETSGGGAGGGNATPSPTVCTAPASIVAAKGYLPASTKPGKTIAGVRARISVSTRSTVGIVATFTFGASGKSHSVAGGAYSMTLAKARNLRVPVPKSLRARLPLGSKAAVTLKITSKPVGASACAAPVEKTAKLKLKVVRVLSGAR